MIEARVFFFLFVFLPLTVRKFPPEKLLSLGHYYSSLDFGFSFIGG
jgi:hypothetical protein